MPALLALLRARSVEPSLSNRCTMDATDNCCRNFSMTGEGDFSNGGSASTASLLTMDLFCWMDCARELILLLRLRGVIGLLEADGIFSRTSLGSLTLSFATDFWMSPIDSLRDFFFPPTSAFEAPLALTSSPPPLGTPSSPLEPLETLFSEADL